MDAPSRVFRLIQLGGDWFWRMDINNDDGLIGPFMSRDDAEKDAGETLGIREGEGWQFQRLAIPPEMLAERAPTKPPLT
jgi:hypothetical protein